MKSPLSDSRIPARLLLLPLVLLLALFGSSSLAVAQTAPAKIKANVQTVAKDENSPIEKLTQKNMELEARIAALEALVKKLSTQTEVQQKVDGLSGLLNFQAKTEQKTQESVNALSTLVAGLSNQTNALSAKFQNHTHTVQVADGFQLIVNQNGGQPHVLTINPPAAGQGDSKIYRTTSTPK